jgi:hypothetical protein
MGRSKERRAYELQVLMQGHAERKLVLEAEAEESKRAFESEVKLEDARLLAMQLDIQNQVRPPCFVP